MWRVGLRELQWRKRRVVVALLATSLVLALTLLLSGASAGIKAESRRVTRLVDTDRFLVADGVSGPFTASTVIPEARVADVAGLPGVSSAEALVALRATSREPGKSLKDVNVLGVDSLAIGDGQVVADTRLKLSVGDRVEVNGVPLTVGAERSGITFNFGLPTLITTVHDAQRVGFTGQPVISAILTEGVPATDPAGFDVLTDDQVIADLDRVGKSGSQTVDFINYLLWIVALGIVASVIYVSVLERTGDLAVFKATGAKTRSLFVAIAMEAIPLTLFATLIAVVLAKALRPGFPFTCEIKVSHVVKLVIFGLGAGLLAGLVGLRRAARTDPAMAFRGGS